MRLIHRLSAFVVLAIAWFFVPAPACAVFTYTWDVPQSLPSPQDNYEAVLRGDARTLFIGGFLNPFPHPKPVTVNFDSGTNTTVVSFAGDPISQNFDTFYTFGFGFKKSAPDFVRKYWTEKVLTTSVQTTTPTIDYNPTTMIAHVTLTNPFGTIDLSQVGYLVTAPAFALTDLNRTTLPLAGFNPSGIPDGTTLLVGQSVSFDILGVLPGRHVTVVTDTKFSGGSSGEPFDKESANYAEWQVPEPSSITLLTLGSLGVIGWTRKGRRALTAE